MSESNPASASGASHRRSSENQDLIAQLSKLLPILQRIQAQAWEEQVAAGHQGRQQAWGRGQLPHSNAAGFSAQSVSIDQLAAAQFVEGMTSTLLRIFGFYIEVNLEKNPSLQPCIGMVIEAAQCFGAGDYARAFDFTRRIYRAIVHIRASDPQLPPIDFTEAVSESAQKTAKTSVH